MSRNPEFQFVSTDTDALISIMTAIYESITGDTVRQASPENLFIRWVADIIIQLRVLLNFAGNQNVPSRADGVNLDALAELFFESERPEAQPAVSTQRFYISAAQSTSILIPSGTRVTDRSGALFWETSVDTYIPIGELFADVSIRCQIPGIIGNGYAIGQINTLVDVSSIAYYDRCENITVSDMGADRATDEEFYQLMRESQAAFSVAGPKDAYDFHAKRVSLEIADVLVNSLLPGQTNIFVLMRDGSIAGSEIKNAVYAACNADEIRPLTDQVIVDDPETSGYDIDFTYFILRNSSVSSADIENAVEQAVDEYIQWQSGRIGRDINPDRLLQLLMGTGIKRAEIRSPVFTPLRDGDDNTIPQVAAFGTKTIVNGGYENE
ncbi:MAG: baseplate J/gp47 family protein [Oscillospiraceae bacterium]|nr:baseplate J/gp47 family protein [Oscillospiraceae bacterium]